MNEGQYRGDPQDFAVFERLLPQKSMFLIDKRPTKDLSVVYRSRNNEIEMAYIKRHQPSHAKPDFSVFIEGSYWGSLNGKLFDDIPALAYALKKRGLTQVEF
ncbi:MULTISPECIES: hypothetical protein [Pseudomonas]|jgi:hypothetical protein|uniref:hypothetical protein n=1 Tax=Pseudomonas TaxID=286 RepID=UPI00062B2745|nr:MULTISPECIES: hypothetical protein [Pseudomonas]KKX57866.1 hypothetical protein PU99_27905 [Pseudomonas putida]MCK8655513.1 hypothetical protein [Pseudomonas umsongensis]NBB58857.1 hypothetical protein [Pseudomonas sp. ODNR1LW]OMQ38981.1 hypothetical protein BKX96_07110 [Pseudomonas putida]